MVDKSGQANIRGIDIDKLAKGFAEEELVFKKFVTKSNTSGRLIRWYQKTAGFLDSTATTTITSSQIALSSPMSLPVIVEQSWTRQESYVKTFSVDSPMISEADIKDNDIDVLATNLRDLVRAVAYQVNKRIYNIMTESQSPSTILTTASTAAWDAGSGQDPIKDINVAIRKIREYNYEPTHMFLSPKDHDSLMTWLISTKGSSVPQFATDKLSTGVIQNILGLQVVVSNSVVADSMTISAPDRAVTWKTFTEITSEIIREPLLGRKIRVIEEGEALLTDPKSVHLTTNTQT
jgi:hypothetical protein